MALGLEDLNQNLKTNENHFPVDKERVLRPWEGYDKLGSQTRTIAAREAVKKAKKIVEQNDMMVEDMRKNHLLYSNDETLEIEAQSEKKRWPLIDFFKKIIS